MEQSSTLIKNAKIRKKEEIVAIMNPLIKEWFFSKFKDFSETQLYGVMPIHERRSILISAPTGGTKTLTAFLAILNYLVELACKNELEDKVYALYTSPLKALSNDIFKNLVEPLKEIEELAEKKKIKMQKIRVGLRTGDTTVNERAKMARKTPHILVTTPESLAIILVTKKFSDNLRNLEFEIVDEIHAMANKRGVHLSLSMEMLETMSNITPVRIGLSATISPLDEIAKFLTGNRECLIAEIRFNKELDIKIVSPVEKLMDTTSGEMHSSLYKMLDELIQAHKTTLIFTNTRSATERVIHHLKEMFPAKYLEEIGAHHSSLSKELRFDIEERLRQGKLKVVVSSTSLELGIDIGYIDLVILLGSPKGTARAIQRIGRAGHKLHEVAKGRFIVLDRDDMVECAVMEKQIIEKKIDRVQIPKNCLDVLSQQIYGMAIARVWNGKELYEVIKKSYCYATLNYEDYLSVISYLAGEYDLEAKNVYGKIWYDPETGNIGKKGKMARVMYMTNIGTIPAESFISVVVAGGEKNGVTVGMIDEGFLEKLKPGDVFVLGGAKYQFAYTRGMKAYVRGSVARPPTIPAWFSEMLPLSFDLAIEIARFRELVREKLDAKKSEKEIKEFIKGFCYCGEKITDEIYEYMREQYRFVGLPGLKTLMIERYHGEKNYWVFHSLYGRRVNDALSRAVAYMIARVGGRDVEMGISDNGFYIAGEEINKEKIEKVINFITEKNVEEILKEALERTEVLGRRFRHCATRSLMILRNYKGRERSVGKQQMKSGFLLTAVKRLSNDFPILKEARREVMEDMMDIENTRKVLELIRTKKIKIVFKETSIPSPFSLNLIMQGHYDLIKMEDRIEFLKRMHKEIQKAIQKKEE